ncbi:MAG: carbohydrate ABC transporter permease [Candidatus Merdivicinus sp.]|jgi:putative aldouronate transport system permease protein
MAHSNRIREGSRLADAAIYVVLAIICLVTLYPMYYVFILSISDPLEAAGMRVYLYPKGLYLDSYKMLFQDTALWRSYWNTLIYVVADTGLMIVVCSLCAYPLTCSRLIGRKLVTVFLLIPMYFGGGLIPTYLVMTKLGLYNNIWAIIVPGAVNVWNIILCHTYFRSIPEDMREAAKIDGANHFKIMTRIYLPLAKPILAVIAIYTVVGVWNDWFRPMVYLPKETLQPLQLYLRRVLVQQTVDFSQVSAEAAEAMARQKLSNLQIRYSMIIFTTLPIIFVYPFFQKYFVKGVMLGSLKG